ncbi:hypothetical protein GP5015_382 [gamma proteobacterium HTCC5015]|nr:hypothetical protein GP5015_382 [gamma proteobacterium HTCC5015]
MPAIIITGDTQPQQIEAIKNSPYQLMHKPIDTALLKRTLQALVQSSTHTDR